LRAFLAAVILACLVLPGLATASSAESFDVLIRGGSIVDGTGAARYVADVGIRGDAIAAIGDLSGATAKTTIDAKGKIVAPGFIDIMMGSFLADGAPELQSMNENSLQMGVTTGVLDTEGGYVDKAQERADLQRSGMGTNMALFVAIGPLYGQVVGAARNATPTELQEMKRLAHKAMEDGAFGIGSATQYCPTCAAPTYVLTEIAKEAAPYHAYFTSHIRNEEQGVMNATRELIEIANGAGIPGHVNHMKVAGPVRCGLAEQTTGLLNAEIAKGRDYSADQYPYTAGQTTDIGILMPAWAQAGTEAEIQLRLRDPAQRPRIVKETNEQIADFVGGPENVTFQPHGDSLADEMRLRGGVAPGEAVVQIRENERTRLTILQYGCEKDVRTIMGQTWTSIGTDDLPDLPIPGKTVQNPRAYGTYPKVLARYVREQHFLGLEEAVRKMTGQPAYRLGLEFAHRGLLKKDWAADVVVFDPDRVMDKSTFQDPAAYSVGIDWVLVNGVLVKQNGQMIPAPQRSVAQPGRVLLHTKEMPTMPQPGYDARPAASSSASPPASNRTPGVGFVVALVGLGALVMVQARRR
jgi:N-acyl-D-aspartate/D-glutamate deacylase